MKILDRYLLKTFVTTLASVFIILFFIFILQTVWLFISELAGKDLDFISVLKFLLFSMPRIVPLVLPLSILLASIMTFGDLAENYEFAAMKSSGISFQRTLKVLVIFMLFLSIIAFWFANNVIPYAEYKFINFRKEIAQRTPAMAIAEGQFSKVGNFSIKVEKKLGENGNSLKGITIHKKSPNYSGNKTVIKAKTGELVSNQGSNILQLVLFDGYYYEDIVPKNYEDREKLPFGKSSFKKYIINIDLAILNKSEIGEGEITTTNSMMNLKELNYTIDSLNKDFKKVKIAFAENSYSRNGITDGSEFINYADTARIKKKNSIPNDLLEKFTIEQKRDVLKVALSTVENLSSSIESSKNDFEYKQKNISSHWIALYEKFAIAFACILMFFLGAPLGSIIRKGGLGLPIVFAVTIFIVYHFVNTFGKRVAQEDGMPAFLGAWISTLILLPLAILLTYRAINDIGGMINFDAISLAFQKLFQKNEIIKEDSISDQTENLSKYQNQYLRFNTISMVLSFLAILFFILVLQTKATLHSILLLITIIALFVSVFITQKNIENIEDVVNKKLDPGMTVSLIIAFPLYILLYFLNKKAIEKEINNYDFEKEKLKIIDLNKNLIIDKTSTIEILKLSYQNASLIAVISNFTAIILFAINYIHRNKVLFLLTIVAVIILYIFIVKSQKMISDIEQKTQQKFDPGMSVSILLGFPLYFIIYFITNTEIKKLK